MTAKSKRPFYVFAAVAFLCCMVMVAGVRGSRADDGRSPLVAGPRVLDRAPTLIPSAEAPDALAHDGDPGATGGPGPGASEESAPDLGRSPVEAELEGPDAPAVEDSGIGVLPQGSSAPPAVADPGVTPPVTDDEPGTKGRGQKKGKDKDKGKDKHGQGGPPGPETPVGPPTTPVAPETQSGDVEPDAADPTP